MQKYKVFINDKWILFDHGECLQGFKDEGVEISNVNDDIIFNLAEMIKTGKFESNIILKGKDDTDRFFDSFLKHFKVLEAAGGIVKNNSKAYLLIKRFGVWDFPKGKIEIGEGVEEAAVREVEEETGAQNLSVLKELPNAYHIYRYGNKWIIKKTYWFLMNCAYEGTLIPQEEEDIKEAVWVQESEMKLFLQDTYKSLKELAKESGII